MTSARRRLAADRAVSERVLSIVARASAATKGPWGICGPAGVMGGLVAGGLDHDRARWLCQMVEDAASALDSETLGRKDGEG
jgi:hypothetical protein